MTDLEKKAVQDHGEVNDGEVQEIELKEGEVRIVLNGQPTVARKGEKIISAAERAGVFIPRFCYHPRMKPVGVCRTCLVEVTGPRGATLQPACYVDVADDMEITTDSVKAKKAQEGVLEFLLVNHPLDCPVCDKGGECPLQDQAYSYGPGETRFIEEKRHWAKPIKLNELVLLDRERCIQCSRCIRFADEVAGEAAIDFVSRGDSIEVATVSAHPMSPYFSGNIVQICPVGALTAAPFRFTSRPWDAEQVESSCVHCALQCRVSVQSQAGKLSRVLGVDSDTVNHGWLCDKGRFLHDAIYSDERICEPLIRKGSKGGVANDDPEDTESVGSAEDRGNAGGAGRALTVVASESGNPQRSGYGDLVPSTWSETLSDVVDHISAALKDKGPQSIALIGGANMVVEDAYAWVKLAKSVMLTDSVDAQMGDGLDADLLLNLNRATIDDACHADCTLLACGDLREELPVLFLRIREAALSGSAKLVELAQEPTSLTKYAVASAIYAPGEAASSLQSIEGQVTQLVGSTGEGLVILLGKASLSQSSEEIRSTIAAMMAKWPNAKYLPILRRGNVMGAIEAGMAPGVAPGMLPGTESNYEKIWDAWPSQVGRDTRSILEAASNGEISVLFLLGSDPIGDFPDSRLAHAALENIPYVVALDAFMTDSSSQADVFLPVALPYEKGGSVVNIEGRLTDVAPKVVPPALVWPEWAIASEIASQLGRDLGFDDRDDILHEMVGLLPGWGQLLDGQEKNAYFRDGLLVHGGGTSGDHQDYMDPIAFPGIASIDQQGAPMLTGLVQDGGGYAIEGYKTDSYRIESYGTESGKDRGSGDHGGHDLQEVEGDEKHKGAGNAATAGNRQDETGGTLYVEQDKEFPLRLVAKRELYYGGTLIGASSSLAPLRSSQRILVNNTDIPAEVAGTIGSPAEESPTVTVVSRSGRIRLPIEISSDIPSGCVVVYGNASSLINIADMVNFVRLEK